MTVSDELSEGVSEEGRGHDHDSQMQRFTMTIQVATQAYFDHQQPVGRRRKTLEWHQMALTVFEHYLRSERQLVYASQITGKDVNMWIACVQVQMLILQPALS